MELVFWILAEHPGTWLKMAEHLFKNMKGETFFSFGGQWKTLRIPICVPFAELFQKHPLKKFSKSDFFFIKKKENIPNVIFYLTSHELANVKVSFFYQCCCELLLQCDTSHWLTMCYAWGRLLFIVEIAIKQTLN